MADAVSGRDRTARDGNTLFCNCVVQKHVGEEWRGWLVGLGTVDIDGSVIVISQERAE